MFVPQAIAAVAASILGASWAGRVGTRKVYLVGLMANVAAMALLVVSATVQHDEAIAYPLLLLATACLGVGFGFTVPALNTFTAAFNPTKVDSSVLVLNALLGLGTALAPVLVAVFVGLDFWWGLPVLAGAVLAALLVVSTRLPFAVDAPSAAQAGPAARTPIPPRFWIFAAFAVCYGICETMNGNWASIDMKDLGASTTQASLALTAFWASVTIGRVLFAAVQRWIPTRVTYRVLPVVLVGVFVLISQLPDDKPALAILSFGLAGLCCSALLPLTISFGQGDLTVMGAAVAGGVIAAYQVGYGIAAFGAGPLQSAGIDLSTLFGFTAIVAAAMAAIGFTITRVRAVDRRPERQPKRRATPSGSTASASPARAERPAAVVRKPPNRCQPSTSALTCAARMRASRSGETSLLQGRDQMRERRELVLQRGGIAGPEDDVRQDARVPHDRAVGLGEQRDTVALRELPRDVGGACIEHRGEQRVLRTEVVVHEPVVHAGPRRDLAHRHVRWSLLGKQLGRGVEQRGAHRGLTVRRAGACRWAAGRGRHRINSSPRSAASAGTCRTS